MLSAARVVLPFLEAVLTDWVTVTIVGRNSYVAKAFIDKLPVTAVFTGAIKSLSCFFRMDKQ